MIPNEGFCKMDALTENGSLKLVPGKEKIVEKRYKMEQCISVERGHYENRNSQFTRNTGICH